MPELSPPLWERLKQHAVRREITIEALLERWLALDNDFPLENYYQLVEYCPASIVVTDPHLPDNPIVYANPAAQTLTGYGVQEILGRNCRFLQGDDRQQPALEEIRQAMQVPQPVKATLRNYRRDGTLFWNDLLIAPLLDENQHVRYFMGVQQDVSARIQADEQLRESEVRFRLLAEATPILIWLSDAQGAATYVNQSWLNFTGRNYEQELGAGWTEGIHPDDYERALRIYNEAVAAHQPYRMEYRLRRHDGEYRWMLEEGVPRYLPDGTFVGLIGTSVDITEQKLAREVLEQVNVALDEHVKKRTTELVEVNERLMQSEARYRAIVEDQLELICRYDPHTYQVTFANEAYKRYFAPQGEEVIGVSFLARIAEENLPHIQDYLAKLVNNTPKAVHEHKNRLASGEERWIRWSDCVIFDEQGQVAEIQAVGIDITERKNAEEALQRQRDFLHKLMETSPAAILVIDRQGQFEFANKRADELLGATRLFSKLFSYQDTEQWVTDLEGQPLTEEAQLVRQVVKTGETIYGQGYRITLPDGRLFFLSVNAAPLLDETGAVEKVILTVEDITPQREGHHALQQALEQEKRLSDHKTRFLSVVSHEFRTPLSVIMTSSELLRHQGEKMTTEQRLTRLERIQGQVNRLTQLLQEVTMVYKNEIIQRQTHPTPLNVTAFLESAVDELQLAFKHTVTIHLQIQPPQTVISGDEQLLHHIVVNLLSNAVKYSREGGKVYLTCNCEAQQVVFTVRDEGIGIPQADQAHLFGMFQRASNVGKISGTGLGLVIVKQAVEAYGGSISFESQEGVGTTFTVTLPLLST